VELRRGIRQILSLLVLDRTDVREVIPDHVCGRSTHARVEEPANGYLINMDELPPDELPSDERGELRTEVGQTLVLVGMAALILVAGLLIGLAL
jgi:hypothetical protein